MLKALKWTKRTHLKGSFCKTRLTFAKASINNRIRCRQGDLCNRPYETRAKCKKWEFPQLSFTEIHTMSTSKKNTLPRRWWMQYPKREKLLPKDFPTDEKPILKSGDVVQIKMKPELRREVIDSLWHRYRYQYVYVIETSSKGFEPYWFFDQLQIVDEGKFGI